MLALRRAEDRGHANHGWLNSHHTFSFGGYYDPRHRGFDTLRVINEDTVAPGGGFATHGPKDMEIVTYVLEGALEHRDSLGTGSVVRPGDVQRMSAGSGVTHSEYNASDSKPVHFLQIWMLPEANGLTPSYEQKTFSDRDKRGVLRLIGSRDGRDGSVTIHQKLDLYATLLNKGDVVRHELAPGRRAWVQIARGSALLGQETLNPGDGAAFVGPASIVLSGTSEAEALLFDMA